MEKNRIIQWWQVLIVLCFISLSSCASTPTSIDKAKAVPTNRLLAYQIKDALHTSNLTVIRDQSFSGSGCYMYFYIDNILSTKIGVGEKATFYIEPGEHLMKVMLDGRGLCKYYPKTTMAPWVQRETIMKAGQSKTFRLTLISGDFFGKFDIIRYE